MRGDAFVKIARLLFREKPDRVGRVLMENGPDERLIRNALAFSLFADRSEVGPGQPNADHSGFLVSLQFSGQAATLGTGNWPILICLVFDPLLFRIEFKLVFHRSPPARLAEAQKEFTDTSDLLLYKAQYQETMIKPIRSDRSRRAWIGTGIGFAVNLLIIPAITSG